MAASPLLIAPSILSADFANLGSVLSQLAGQGADWVHVDVMDGMFVPNLTIGPPIIQALRPHTALPFDVHLMIEQPDRYLEAYRDAGADGLTVHAEACIHLNRVLQQIRDLGCRVGVSLNPATPVSVLENVIDMLDLVLIMSVNPGFGGQSFIPQTLKKLRQLRELLEANGRTDVLVQVDGGIHPGTVRPVVDAGANVLVAGSAVFGQPDVAKAIAALRV